MSTLYGRGGGGGGGVVGAPCEYLELAQNLPPRGSGEAPRRARAPVPGRKVGSMRSFRERASCTGYGCRFGTGRK